MIQSACTSLFEFKQSDFKHYQLTVMKRTYRKIRETDIATLHRTIYAIIAPILLNSANFAKLPGLVTDGRDSTIVFPNAQLSFI